MDIKIKELKINLAKKEIVKGIDLAVRDNKFVGLIGPNGSGKSTLLKALYGVLKPAYGEILVCDKNIEGYPKKVLAKTLGVVSQFNNINFDFKVIDIVLMGRSAYKKLLEKDNKTDYDLALKALASVGMMEASQKNFNLLSGGEKQRVILARAITQEPRLLILDEPTNHLDIKYQLEVMSIVKNLSICVLAALKDLLYNKYLEIDDGNAVYSYVHITDNYRLIDYDVRKDLEITEANLLKSKIKKENKGRFDEDFYRGSKTIDAAKEGANKFLSSPNGLATYKYKLENSKPSGDNYSTIYADLQGNYVDTDYSLGKLKVYMSTTGPSVTIKNTDDTYELKHDGKVYVLKAEIKQNKYITAVSDTIYRYADLTIYKKEKNIC